MATPSERSQTADRRELYTFAPLKRPSYWTEVHQSFTQCSQINADEPFEIKLRYTYRSTQR